MTGGQGRGTTVVPGAAQGSVRPLLARGAGVTHRGHVRERNEDAILTDPTGRLWAVADGMGGYAHGEVASDTVIDCLAAILDGESPAEALALRLAEANARVRERAAMPGMGPMGATVVALFIMRGVAHLAWAGDSRAYLLRAGALRQLTRDHTVVQDLVTAGALRAEDAESHPEAHIVTRAVGGAALFEPGQMALPLWSADRLMLCSDGLTRVVDDGAIAEQLGQAAPPDRICAALLSAALDRGAPDNVSVIVIDLAEG